MGCGLKNAPNYEVRSWSAHTPENSNWGLLSLGLRDRFRSVAINKDFPYLVTKCE